VIILAPFAVVVRATSNPLGFGVPPAWRPRDPSGCDGATYARRQY